MTGEDINIKDAITIQFLIILLVIGVSVFAATYLRTGIQTKGSRIDRMENLMKYESFTYGGYSINQNMTLSEVRTFYNTIPYEGAYKTASVDMALNCLCDGSCDTVRMYLK